MFIQPFGEFQSRTYIDYSSFKINQMKKINVRTFAISINLNLTKNNNEQPDNLYYNEDKKY
jgi:hypothetical protein